MTKPDIEPCGPGCGTCVVVRRAVEVAGGRFGVDALTTELLTHVTGLPPHVVREHAGDLPAFVRATYVAVATDLQDRWTRDLWITPSWPEGIASAVTRHVGYLMADPARARFCYVGARGGDPELRAERQRIRQRSVEVLAHYHRMVAPGEPCTLFQLELVQGAIAHTIGEHVREGTLGELRASLGDVLAAVAPEAAAFVA